MPLGGLARPECSSAPDRFDDLIAPHRRRHDHLDQRRRARRHGTAGGAGRHPQGRWQPQPSPDHLDRPRRRPGFVRSTNGRGADWFRAAIATGAGQIHARGTAYDVRFTEVRDEAGLAAADAGYRAKYGHYPSVVEHLEEDGPRAATLEVHPA